MTIEVKYIYPLTRELMVHVFAGDSRMWSYRNSKNSFCFRCLSCATLISLRSLHTSFFIRCSNSYSLVLRNIQVICVSCFTVHLLAEGWIRLSLLLVQDLLKREFRHIVFIMFLTENTLIWSPFLGRVLWHCLHFCRVGNKEYRAIVFILFWQRVSCYCLHSIQNRQTHSLNFTSSETHCNVFF